MPDFAKKVFDPAAGVVPPWKEIDAQDPSRVTVVTVNGVKYWREEVRPGDRFSGTQRTEGRYWESGQNVGPGSPNWSCGWSHFFVDANTPYQWGLFFQPLHYTELPPQVGGPLCGLSVHDGKVYWTVRADPDHQTSGHETYLLDVPAGQVLCVGCQVIWGDRIDLWYAVDTAPDVTKAPQLSIRLVAPSGGGAYGPQGGVYENTATSVTVVDHLGKVVRGTTIADVVGAWAAAPAPTPVPTPNVALAKTELETALDNFVSQLHYSVARTKRTHVHKALLALNGTWR